MIADPAELVIDSHPQRRVTEFLIILEERSLAMGRPAGKQGGRPNRLGGPFRPVGANLPTALVSQVALAVRAFSSDPDDHAYVSRQIHRCLEWGLAHEASGAPAPYAVYASEDSETQLVNWRLAQKITDAVIAPYEKGECTLTGRVIELLHRGLASKGCLEVDILPRARAWQPDLGLELTPTGT